LLFCRFIAAVRHKFVNKTKKKDDPSMTITDVGACNNQRRELDILGSSTSRRFHYLCSDGAHCRIDRKRHGKTATLLSQARRCTVHCRASHAVGCILDGCTMAGLGRLRGALLGPHVWRDGRISSIFCASYLQDESLFPVHFGISGANERSKRGLVVGCASPRAPSFVGPRGRSPQFAAGILVFARGLAICP
jgi:hypothetical protein